MVGILSVSGLALAACGGNGGGSNVAGHEEVTLTLVTSDTPDADNMQPFFDIFLKRVEEEVPWVDIEHRGGPEVMDASQIAESVGSGTIDMGLVQASAYTEQIPIAYAMKLTTQSPTEERESGVYDVIRDQHAEDANVHYLGKAMSGNPYRFYLTREPEHNGEVRFDGMPIRVSPVYVPIVVAKGGQPVQTSPQEAYTALERGVAQGLGYPSTGFLDRGFDEVTQYELDIPFFDASFSVLLNLETWQELDTGTRDALTQVMKDTEPEIVERVNQMVEEEAQGRREAGIELIKPSEEARDDFLQTAYDAAWDEAIEKEPAARELRQIFGN